jgi:hypothetical protein
MFKKIIHMGYKYAWFSVMLVLLRFPAGWTGLDWRTPEQQPPKRVSRH